MIGIEHRERMVRERSTARRRKSHRGGKPNQLSFHA
jgi:hypothetical protein